MKHREFGTDKARKAIENFKEAIIKVPSKKIHHSNENRIEDFCVFIMSYGRPNDVKTLDRLTNEKSIFNQDYYIVCSDDDKHLKEYIELYGERVLVFNKKKMVPFLDKGDNFDKYNVILYQRNICFTFAKVLGYRYFTELDDDYSSYGLRQNENGVLRQFNYWNMDRLFKIHLDFLKNTKMRTIAMAQGGDFIGGIGNPHVKRGYNRKVMNSFFCDVQYPFLFDGTINEDVNYYVQSGMLGIPNMTLYGYMLNQQETQSKAGGMTEMYLDGGTYLKTFYTILYQPSQAKIGTIGHGNNERIHHAINQKNAYVQILDEKYKYSNPIEKDDW